MPVKSVTFNRLLHSAGITSNAPATTSAKESEPAHLDLIDQMHELAKLGHTPWTISESLDVPYVSVEYWWYANGYNRD
jgi:hypothetical protein